jgi:hypothetical protein
MFECGLDVILVQSLDIVPTYDIGTAVNVVGLFQRMSIDSSLLSAICHVNKVPRSNTLYINTYIFILLSLSFYVHHQERHEN